MTSKLSCIPLLLSTLTLSAINTYAADDHQTVTVSDKLQIPGATLKSGTYTLSVEDRLADRAIVRISSSSSDKHYLLLTVPNGKLSTSSDDSLLYFSTSTDKKDALRAWKCGTCSMPLEFVYPKLDAVKLTDDSTQPVLAVDPTYDKLPSNLSADDMKVVTLWLLSPERITADNVGKGVKAVKYTPDASVATQETASSSAPAVAQPEPTPTVAAPTPSETGNSQLSASVEAARSARPATSEVASNSLVPVSARRQLPKTASNTYALILSGMFCLAAAIALQAKRVRNPL